MGKPEMVAIKARLKSDVKRKLPEAKLSTIKLEKVGAGLETLREQIAGGLRQGINVKDLLQLPAYFTFQQVGAGLLH